MSGRGDGDLEKPHMKRAAPAGQDEPTLDAQTQMQLGRILTQYGQDLINQPVPDIFLSLLAKLEAREREAP